MNYSQKIALLELGIKNQQLISKCLEYRRFSLLPELKNIDRKITNLIYFKADSQPQYYIWRTQGDEKVRGSHAANEGKVFSYANPPPTGNPGEEYGCRCFAEPYEINDPPIEDVYPELVLLPLLRVGRGVFSAVAKIVNSQGKALKNDKLTEHGTIRSTQRKITQEEAKIAMQTAERTGNVITKTGKYGTLQKHYKGSNGITVIQETSGRNAGKIITFWRHK